MVVGILNILAIGRMVNGLIILVLIVTCHGLLILLSSLRSSRQSKDPLQSCKNPIPLIHTKICLRNIVIMFSMMDTTSRHSRK